MGFPAKLRQAHFKGALFLLQSDLPFPPLRAEFGSL